MTHSCMTRLIDAWHDSSMCDMTHWCVKDSFMRIPHMHRYGVNQKLAHHLIFFGFSSSSVLKHTTACLLAICLLFVTHKIHTKICTRSSSFWFASIFHLFLCDFFWTQDKGGMDMGLVEREMHCVARYMRRICHLMSRLPHAKSPTVLRCDAN